MIAPVLAAPAERTIVVRRSFKAPADRVFKLWTDPELVAQWWGIEHATNPLCQLDVRPGGAWRIDMRTRSGSTYRNHGVYLEVVENQRLVFTDIPDATLAEWAGNPPQPSVHTLTLRPQVGGTDVELVVLFQSAADRDHLRLLGMHRGLAQGFDRLERLIAEEAAA